MTMRNETLIDRIGTENLSHAYLFESMDQDDAEEQVRAFAAKLFCKEDVPCGVCSHCMKIKAGSHPDLITIEPVKDTIGIDQIRRVTDQLHLAPLFADRKIVHITRSQYMRVQAQNALLKTLEEPPAYGMIILSITNAKRILPTIRSRCQLIRSGAVRKPATIDRGMLEELLSDVASGDIDRAFRAPVFFQDYKDDKEELLQEMEKYFRDLLLYKTTGEKSLLSDRSFADRAHDNKMEPAHILRVLDLLITIREGFRRNVNFQLSMERIMIEMLEENNDPSSRRTL